MTPVSLVLCAFGPYRSRQEIDFAPIVEAGLVLIHGETGAGKTALLDGITYALYGASSGGARGDLAAMRSLGTPDDAETVVEYTFDLRGVRYRFSRGVNVRRKRTGTVEMTQWQNAGWLEKTGIFHPFFENPKQKDVSDKSEELIGLSREQFCQVMMLPQGKFEQLLTARSDEKETVLVSLFHAERWQQAAERLCERAVRKKQTLEQEKSILQTLLAGFACSDAAALEVQRQQAAVRLDALEREREVAAAQLAQTRALLESEKLLESIFLNEERTVQQLAELSQRDEVAERDRISRARLAAALAPEYAQLQAREQEAERRSRLREQAAARLEAASGAYARRKAARTTLEQAQTQVETLRDERLRLLALTQARHALEDGKPCPVCGSLYHAESSSAHPAAEAPAEWETRLEEIAATLSRQETLLDEAHKSCETAALAEQDAKTAALHAVKEHTEAINLLQTAQSGWQTALKQSLFADVQSWQNALLPEKTLAQIEAELSGHAARRQAATALLAQLREQIAGRKRPATAARESAFTLQQAALRALDTEQGSLTEQYQRMQKALTLAQKQQETIERESLLLDKLTAFGRLLRGDTGISLRRYVLGVMLSSITAAANELLRHVHGGRYRLYRTTERVGNARKAGLDLEVLDAYTGGMRSVTGLSGGEKFLVSLALALGLAEVVQAQMGGIRMDAMFIDEGFGSLDPASVSDALEMLAGIRGSRRLVGVISHLPALRETIEASIEVVKAPGGSSLRFHL